MNPKIDFIRDAFLKFLKDGHTAQEALEEFDRDEFNAALWAEIESGAVFYNRETFKLETRDGKPSLLDLGGMAARARCDDEAMGQAYELWMAGWKNEPVTPNSQAMSWYWRRPPRRKGSKGMLFLSTNQAFMHMRRSQNKPIA